ncbi:MAG TPA: protein kinase [Gemmatimonadaceae bacterium]|nr:protein kinase [Gemmatimonadaceae bacterium]
MNSPPLRHLGKYQLTDVLGRGAMGVVYRAFDPVLNRYLAIKVMSDVIAGDVQLRDRFLREAQAAGSLQHPNVVTVYDFGEADAHLFIAMEYVEGVDLAEMIARRDDVPVAAKLDIMIDALSGLAYAHSHGLVHRDVKPGNIRVAEDHHAKLMDFGIARMGPSSLTQTGALLGTPEYMAPEQVKGGEITAAADIFGAGAVLYEFLTYTKPFSGDSLHVILYKIVSEEPAPLRKIVPSLPLSLEVIVAKALAKDPEARYGSALEMAKVLTRARNELTGTAERPAVTIRTSSRTLAMRRPPAEQKRRRLVGMAAGLAVAAAASLALWMFGPWPAKGTVPGPAAATPAVQSPAQPLAVVESLPRSARALKQPDAPRPGASSALRPRPGGEAASVVTQDSMVRAVRANVVGNRRVAQDAGASAAELAHGDSLLRVADALMAQGRAPEAVGQLSMASVRWIDAERSARERASRDRPSPSTERASVAPPPVSVPLAPAAEKAAAPQVPTAAADPRPDIERVIDAYARAIESGSVGEIRRAYPGLTGAQQQQWEGFFRSVRNFKPRLVLDQLAVTGATAEARISATYTYESRASGQADRQNFALQATLNRDAGSWRLASIR